MNRRCAGADSSGSAGAQASRQQQQGLERATTALCPHCGNTKCINPSAPPMGRPRLCRCCSRALQFPKAVPHRAAPCHNPHTSSVTTLTLPSPFDPLRAALLAHGKTATPALRPGHTCRRLPPSLAYSAAQVTLPLP